MHIVPLGINIPSYQSSFVVRCGIAIGTGGRHRRTSLTMACTYGRLGASEKVGTRERPTTVSSSACARFCTSGCAIIASVHQLIAVEVVSAPPELDRSSPSKILQDRKSRTHYKVPTVQAISRLESPLRSAFLMRVALTLGLSDPLDCHAST